MIAYIEGTVVDIVDGWMTVNTPAGIGYEIKYGDTLSPVVGQPIRVFVEHAFTQDSQRLFGYGCAQERALCKQVGKADKVGPSIAHAIVTTIGVAKLLKMVRGIIPPTEIKVRGVGPDKMAAVMAVLKKAKLDTVEATVADPRIIPVRTTLTMMGHKGDKLERVLNELATKCPSATPPELVTAVLQRIQA